MDYILFEVKEDIARITFNRPKTLNALNKEILNELDTIITKIENDDKIRYIIFTGTGKAFIAGADIAEMKNMTKEEAFAYGKLGSKIFKRIEILQKISIAVINGYCLGGGLELAMACDVRIASAKAKFGQPEVTLGIIPGFSGSVRLPRLIGITKAKELLYTGKIIDADEALNIGLVNTVVSSESLYEEENKFISLLKKNSFNALKNIKQIFIESNNSSIDKAIELENKHFSKCFTHNDQKEGMTAFLEKRQANFE